MVNCVITTFNSFDNTQVKKIQWVATSHENYNQNLITSLIAKHLFSHNIVM